MPAEGLQFFATNRSMETLSALDASGGEKDRDVRVKLQSGGYYFVDADKYMSYYFAQVDSDIMPAEAVVRDSNDAVFDAFLARKEIGRVVVCVHGFNVHFHHAITWFRILTNTMRNAGYAKSMALRADDPAFKDAADGSLTAFIGFSWPSNGSVLAYNRDQADAVASGQAFANLLARIRVHGKRVSLLCHSMGNYMACNALAGLVNKVYQPVAMTGEYIKARFPAKPDKDAIALEVQIRSEILRSESQERRPPYLIDDFVMIAPDVERRHVTKSRDETSRRSYVGPFYSGLEHVVERVTNVYSRFDGALAVSTLEKKPKDWVLKAGEAIAALTPWGMLDELKRDPDNKWEMRLGSSAHPVTAPPNFRSLNATEIAARPIDHSDHIDSRDVAKAIAAALDLKAAP